MLELSLEQSRLNFNVAARVLREPFVPTLAARVLSPYEELSALEDGIGELKQTLAVLVDRGNPLLALVRNVKEEIARTLGA